VDLSNCCVCNKSRTDPQQIERLQQIRTKFDKSTTSPQQIHQGSHRPRTPPPVLPPNPTARSSPVRPLPATGIPTRRLQPSPGLRVSCASAGRRRRAALAYVQIHKTGSMQCVITELRRQRRIEPRLLVTCTKIRENRTCDSKDMIADEQTHTQTDTLITILPNNKSR